MSCLNCNINFNYGENGYYKSCNEKIIKNCEKSKEKEKEQNDNNILLLESFLLNF